MDNLTSSKLTRNVSINGRLGRFIRTRWTGAIGVAHRSTRWRMKCQRGPSRDWAGGGLQVRAVNISLWQSNKKNPKKPKSQKKKKKSAEVGGSGGGGEDKKKWRMKKSKRKLKTKKEFIPQTLKIPADCWNRPSSWAQMEGGTKNKSVFQTRPAI